MVNIRNWQLEVPIIQGGMGVGVSLGNLAGAVAHAGGMGVVSTVNAGYREADFNRNPLNANLRALKQEITKAKDMAQGNGLVAINIMVAVNHYEETVRAAVEAGVQAIISGAGLPMELPSFVDNNEVALAPIVSSGKAAKTIMRYWEKKHNRLPDFIVIEGPMAGGHLGFKRDEIEGGTAKNTSEILQEVLIEIAEFEEKYKSKIPVFVGGGVFDGSDMASLIAQGASGVQIGTRFIATKECDASEEYKNVIISAKEEDVVIIKSPVGMPGRSIRTPLIKRLEEGISLPPNCCNDCLKACPHGNKTPYCISRALIEAVKGNYEEGLFFCGANVGRINTMTTVPQLIDEIMTEYNK